MDKLQIFASLISEDYYFSCEEGKNLWEWYDEKKNLIIISGDYPHYVYGVDHIGRLAAALDLCCSAEWNTFTNRLEIRVH